MKKIILTVLFLLLYLTQISYSQANRSNSKSIRDWQYAIDTTWGAGLPTAQKVQLFNAFWTKVDQTWGGFPNLIVNWDSLYDYYSPICSAGVSRGRFYGILSKMKLALNENHVWIKDFGIDSTMGFYTINGNEYPNYFSFHYLPGIPLLNLFSTYFRTNFGAGVTALPDGSALVYSVMPNHPLNLQPGDIILGYDGITWTQNLSELFEAELPALLSGAVFASSTESFIHNSITCAGMNWGLFETIDVLKYGTNDTMHYPTSLLESITQPYFIATEQMPINGVPFPDLSANKLVSWGVVQGTNIGYIYVWDWTGVPNGQTKILFEQAVDELMHINNVDGLILDFRTNIGGWPSYANDGFKYLFNIDPTSNYSRAIRVPGNDHFLFTIMSPDPLEPFTPNSELFEHPIAVLTGPRCMSAGDINAFRMRFHPMARFFGKKTTCAYTDYNTNNFFDYSYYRYRVDNGCVYSNYNNEEYLTHKGFPVDEEVWLTRDGVANGQDDVVNRALEWMNNLVYPHNIVTDKTFYSPAEDTVQLSTIIANPNSHQISARGYIHNLYNVLIDSVDFVQQKLNTDRENWTTNLTLPQLEEYYKLTVTAFDQTTSDHFTLPNATRFTTVGPVTLDSVYVFEGTNNFFITPYLKNQSTDSTIKNASVKLICNDPWIISINPTSRDLPDILPGAIVSPTTAFVVTVDTLIFPDYFNFEVEVISDGWTYWTDSMRVPPIAIININPTELAFGEVAVDSSATKTFTITNYGDEDLVISNITSNEPVFTVNITSAVVPPDSSQSVEVTFTPTAAISFNGKIEITHNAAGSPDSVTVTGDGVTGVEDELQPLTYSLEQNYPNPFNPSTKIKYSVPQSSQVQIKIFDVLGNEIETLVNEEKRAGTYEINWNAINLPSGVYFYQLRAGEFVSTKKMILLK
jgi:hypothetical protein